MITREHECAPCLLLRGLREALLPLMFIYAISHAFAMPLPDTTFTPMMRFTRFDDTP